MINQFVRVLNVPTLRSLIVSMDFLLTGKWERGSNNLFQRKQNPTRRGLMGGNEWK